MDQSRVEGFVHKALGDLGSALTASLVVIGDKLGLYRAMADAGPLTPAELATRTGTVERCVREWLAAQAAAGYVDYDAASQRYSLPAEHAVALTDEDSPACVLGGFQGMTAAMRAEPKVAEAFRSGKGVGLARTRPAVVRGRRTLLPSGIQRQFGERVDSGARRRAGEADRRVPASPTSAAGTEHRRSSWRRPSRARRFVGFDYHRASIERARARAVEAGVSDRVQFEVASGEGLSGNLRPRCLLRLPARHGRPGRRRRTRAAVTHARTARGSWSSPTLPTRPKTTSTPWAGSSTPCQRWCAHRRRWRRKWVRHWVPRPVRRGCATS